MVEIRITAKEFKKKGSAYLKKAATETLNLASLGKIQSLTILIADDESIRGLNNQYRQIDNSTDVLSFPSNFSFPDSSEKYLGDIAISYPTALRQSISAGHPVESELSLLVVHGVLHLLGFDHDTLLKKKEMWSMQTRVLQVLGIQMDSFSGDD